MSEKTSDRSADFNLFLASDAVLGALRSIFDLTSDIPDKEQERMLWLNALTGLAWSGHTAARELNKFLHEASDMHRFPNTYRDLEGGEDEHGVRETSAIYLVKAS